MEDPDFFMDTKIAIWGLGLIGGSLALALQGRCKMLLGIDPDADTLAAAQKMGLVDFAASAPDAAIPQANMIILAAPVSAILDHLKMLPRLHSGSAVILDVGSTKSEIIASMDMLPDRFDPIGGHPICGKEKSSLVHADKMIFQGAPFGLVSLPRTSVRAKTYAEHLVQIVGSYPLWLDPEAHDRWVAATSHLPYLVANALAAATPQAAAPLAGPGLRSTTRLAGSSPRMMRDICASNRDAILAALGRFRSCLDTLEDQMSAGDYPGLERSFTAGKNQHEVLTSGSAQGDRS
ncbi:MAG: prephenate dehydrogenase/arogenate dehydrogenase family protein [Anaerolineaceae bacterium]|nr:prephenate dehydrogenase/arogenate dehydrogenase family protein [Anaerolineaceae bacterium]